VPCYLALGVANLVVSFVLLGLLQLHWPMGVIPGKILVEALVFPVMLVLHREFACTRNQTRHWRSPVGEYRGSTLSGS